MRIAIDGPCGSGKSSLGKTLARKLGFLYIDTGAMYRAVALAAQERGVPARDATSLERLAERLTMEFRHLGEGQRLFVDGRDVTDAIREPDVSKGASEVSSIPGVRRAMVCIQREMGGASDVVMDGRDIGTVVFPEAEVKIFLDAHLDERAHRRWVEEKGKGRRVGLSEVREEIVERDRRDLTRVESPLRCAEDAVRIDTTGLSIGQVLEAMECVVSGRRRDRRETCSQG